MPLTRWSRRHKKTFGKKEESVWDGNFRQPPKPKSYYTKVKGLRWEWYYKDGKRDGKWIDWHLNGKKA